jgi:Glyoxalase-like domain
VSAAVDHLVVAAPSLAQGAQWCEAVLGVVPGPGGAHPLMGTHNRLLNIAGAAFAQSYLEIIAIDPAVPPPARARWFGLDDIDLREGPRLLHFVARSSGIDAQCAALRGAGFDPGPAIAASRETPHGRLEWRITLRNDGRLLAGGALPTLIEWGATHPTEAMPVSGIALHTLTLRGLPPAAAQALGLRGVDLAADAGPAITAAFDTPRGRVVLHSD